MLLANYCKQGLTRVVCLENARFLEIKAKVFNIKVTLEDPEQIKITSENSSDLYPLTGDCGADVSILIIWGDPLRRALPAYAITKN